MIGGRIAIGWRGSCLKDSALERLLHYSGVRPKAANEILGLGLMVNMLEDLAQI